MLQNQLVASSTAISVTTGMKLTAIEILEVASGAAEVLGQLEDIEPWYRSVSRVVKLGRVCSMSFHCDIGEVCLQAVCRTIAAPAFSPTPVASPSGGGVPPVPAAAPGSQATSCPLPPPTALAICVGSTWYIAATVQPNGTFIVPGATVINGSLILTNSTTIQIRGAGVVQTTGCVTFGGALEAVVDVPQTSQNVSVTLISFPAGYCGNQTSQFTNVTITSTRLQPCERGSGELVYGPRSLIVLFSVVKTESCSVPLEGSALVDGLGIGAIAGITAGAVALVLLAIFGVWMLRRRVIPAYSSNRRMRKALRPSAQTL